MLKDITIYKNEKNFKTPESFGLKGLYENGYNVLWNFKTNANPFIFGTVFWLKEEERRIFIFEYWKKFNIIPPTKILENYSKEKMKEDIKSFNFLLLYMHYFVRYSLKKNLKLDRIFLNFFNKYTFFISKHKDYSLYFLKQPNSYLKKYENIKSLLDKNLIGIGSSSFSDFSFKIIMSEYNAFDYFYLFPESLDKVFDKISQQSLFFRLYDKLSATFIFFKDNFSLRRFLFFLDSKFFSLNLDFFFEDVFLKKKSLNTFLFDIIESVVITDQNEYILKLDPYFDLSMFTEEYSFVLSDYLFFDFFELEEQFLVKDSFSFMYDHFAYLTYENDIKYFNSDAKLMKIDKIFDINIFFISEFSFFFSKINHLAISNVSIFRDIFFLYKKYSYIKNISLNLVNIYDEPTSNKYKISENFGEAVAGLSKNLIFNPSNVRSFFIQKLISLREMGNVKKFDSYSLFLEKYLYYDYYNSNIQLDFLVYPSFKRMQNKQKNYTSDLDFFGNNYKKYYFSVLGSFDYIRLGYVLGYLNLIKFKEKNNYILDNKDNPLFKDPIESQLINLKNSAFVLKYNMDFFSKVYSSEEEKVSDSLFSFDENLSYYNKDFLYLNFLSFTKKIVLTLGKF